MFCPFCHSSSFSSLHQNPPECYLKCLKDFINSGGVKCAYCEYRSPDLNNLANHVESVHLAIKTENASFDELDALLDDFNEIIDKDSKQPAAAIEVGVKIPEPTTMIVTAEVKQEEGIKCDLCDYYFEDENFLHLHNALVHAPVNNIKSAVEYQCKQCPVKFANFDEYVSHLKSSSPVHGDEKPACRFKTEGSPYNKNNNDLDALLNDCNEIIDKDSESTDSIPEIKIPEQNALITVGPNNVKPETRSPVKCDLCGYNFDDENFLHLHKALLHSPSKAAAENVEYQCRQCALRFTVFDAYVTHLRNVHGDNRVVCEKCGKLFKLRGSLLVHQRVVHNPNGIASFHCSVCNRKFNNKYRRDLHEKKTHKKGGKAVEEKDKNLNNKEGDEKPASGKDCSICGSQFETQAALILHSVSHIKPETSQDLPAFPNAPSTSAVALSLKSDPSPNNNNSTNNNVKQWECEICKKSFTTKYFLKKHHRLHTGETPYECQLCGKAFAFQQSFHKHMLYHTDEKPYSCGQCGRAFKELSTLQNHERIHSGERPFACETCGKSFRQRVSYLVHRRIHTGVMPYSCDACGKNFRYKVTQRTHKCHPPKLQTASQYPQLPANIQKDLQKLRAKKKGHHHSQQQGQQLSPLVDQRLQELTLNEVKIEGNCINSGGSSFEEK